MYNACAKLYVDVLSGPPGTKLTFYGPPPLRVTFHDLELDENDEELEVNQKTATATECLLGSEAVALRGGLWLAREVALQTSTMNSNKTIADIAVSGLQGWIAVSISSGEERRHYSTKLEYERVNQQDIKLRIWAPKGIEVFVRPPLPTASVQVDRHRSRRNAPASPRSRRRPMDDFLILDEDDFEDSFDDGQFQLEDVA